MSKDNTVLYIALGAAVLGYLAFKQGGFLNKGAQSAIAPAYIAPNALASATNPQLDQYATETIQTPSIIAPPDPTGMQITFL
jgi:hypothetical protein